MVALWDESYFLLGFLFSVSGCFLRCFPFPLLHGVQPSLSIPCYPSRLPSSVPAVSVRFAVFGVCFRLLSLFRVLSSCVDPFPLFCFFRCLRVLVGPFPSACPRLDLRFPFASGPPIRKSPCFFPAFLLLSVLRI